MSRVILDCLIVVAVIHGWWFVALPLALIGTMKYHYFIELLVAGLMYDSIFGLVPMMGLLGYIGILSTLSLFIVITLLKKILRK